MLKRHIHINKLPEDFKMPKSVAIDIETTGLDPVKDKICTIQLATDTGDLHLIKIEKLIFDSNIYSLLVDKNILKILHFARFDIAFLIPFYHCNPYPIFCTKVAAKMTYDNLTSYSLKPLLKEILNIEISKTQQISDWSAKNLTEEQLDYAFADVQHLHALKDVLDIKLTEQFKSQKAYYAFNCIQHFIFLDEIGVNPDIFKY